MVILEWRSIGFVWYSSGSLGAFLIISGNTGTGEYSVGHEILWLFSVLCDVAGKEGRSFIACLF